MNARSIVNKLLEFRHYIDLHKPDIVCVTESFLDVSIDSNLLLVKDYSVFRCDRNRHGGGVLVLVKNTLGPVALNFVPMCECVLLECVSASIKFRVVVIYRGDLSREYLLRVFDAVDFANNTFLPVVILGDFNMNLINWVNLTLARHDNVQLEFLNFVLSRGLSQHVFEDTHIHGNILDLILCNVPNLILNVSVGAPIAATCDHYIVSCDLNVQPKNTVSNPYYNYYKADYFMLGQFFYNVNWDNAFLNCVDIEDFCSVFYDIVAYATALYCPFVMPSVARNRLPRHLEQLRRSRNRLWHLYRHDKTNLQRRRSYYTAVNRFNLALRKHRLSVERNVSTCPNSNKFYSFVRRNFQPPQGIPALSLPDGNFACNDLDKASALNNYFCSVFNVDNAIIPPLPNVTRAVFNDIVVSPNVVFKSLRRLKSNCSAGVDNVPPIFLNRLAHVLCFPLAKIFSVSLATGKLPDIWKTAIVVPLHKKGSTSLCDNYRPISLTSCLCKTLERLLDQHIRAHVLSLGLISEVQHGFLSKRSCESQLLDCMAYYIDSLMLGNEVDILFIDLKRAFDSVVHAKLIAKLSAFGIAGNCLQWIGEYLSDRKQCVKVGQACSEWLPVTSGVPQGSILGPLLFLLYVNDIPLAVNQVQCALFADDTKLYSNICTPADRIMLQDSLNVFAQWCIDWQLTINTNKCSLLSLPGISEYEYFLGNETIPVKNCERDLGVFFSNDLSFHNHISKLCESANLRCSFIFRCFSSRSKDFLCKLFVTYVRPILEYCSSVWYPVTLRDIDMIENVQRSFTRRIYGFASLSYFERLVACNLDSLENRRLCADLAMTYKILRGFIDIDKNKLFAFNRVYNTRANNSMKLFKRRCDDSKLYSDFLAFRVFEAWNSLPDDVVSAPTVKLFRSKLSNANLSSFIEGRTLRA